MDRASAEATMATLAQLNTHIGAMIELIRELPDSDMQCALGRSVGDLMSQVNDDIMRPIVRNFPDLDPDR